MPEEIAFFFEAHFLLVAPPSALAVETLHSYRPSRNEGLVTWVSLMAFLGMDRR